MVVPVADSASEAAAASVLALSLLLLAPQLQARPDIQSYSETDMTDNSSAKTKDIIVSGLEHRAPTSW